MFIESVSEEEIKSLKKCITIRLNGDDLISLINGICLCHLCEGSIDLKIYHEKVI